MAVLTLHHVELLTSAEKSQKLQKPSILFLTVKVTESSCTCIMSPAETLAKSLCRNSLVQRQEKLTSKRPFLVVMPIFF